MPKKHRVNKTKGKKKKNVRSRRRGGRKELRGGGLFENVRNWFAKTAYKMTPVPKKLLFMKVKDNKTGKLSRASVLPRSFWKATGVPKSHLDQFKYLTK